MPNLSKILPNFSKESIDNAIYNGYNKDVPREQKIFEKEVDKMKDMKKVLDDHYKWLRNDPNGKRADLREANLRGANLCEANLYAANLRGANLRDADLRGADLCEANLRDADLREANLRGANLYAANLCEANLREANLRDANLCEANLRDADLRGADLYAADLRGADLREANLRGANLRGAMNVFYPIACPEYGSFVGWKKANNYIVELLITENAKRCSGTGRKCRCSEAVVLAIENIDGSNAYIDEVSSYYDSSFVYRVGELVKEENFNDDRWSECAAGIHFFITRKEAVDY